MWVCKICGARVRVNFEIETTIVLEGYDIDKAGNIEINNTIDVENALPTQKNRLSSYCPSCDVEGDLFDIGVWEE